MVSFTSHAGWGLLVGAAGKGPDVAAVAAETLERDEPGSGSTVGAVGVRGATIRLRTQALIILSLR